MKAFLASLLYTAQCALLRVIYRHEARVLVTPARLAYRASIEVALRLHGSQAHCNEIDPDLWELVTNLFKGETGSKPRFHMTFADASDYVENYTFYDPSEEGEIGPSEADILANGVGEPTPTAMELALRQAGLG